MMKAFGAICAIILLCGGCAGSQSKSRKIILKDPQTMEFVECKVTHDWGLLSIPDEDQNKCVEEYKKKGYVVWGEI
jgi:hypothetical protein